MAKGRDKHIYIMLSFTIILQTEEKEGANYSFVGRICEREGTWGGKNSTTEKLWREMCVLWKERKK